MTAVKFLLLKIHNLELRISTLEMILQTAGNTRKEHHAALLDQLANSPEAQRYREEIRNLGPTDVMIPQFAQAVEASRET
ncbi:MAG TPA: hypothetical protein VKU01_20650 [Bryobacteraceae bacterium]|nr:hypothetical protein [Bryobacteraceae bacterium]